jgi:hypothetical protein
MSSLSCNLCSSKFNSLKARPQITENGQTYCEICVASIFKGGETGLDPNTMGPIKLDNLRVNYEMLEQVVKVELLCSLRGRDCTLSCTYLCEFCMTPACSNCLIANCCEHPEIKNLEEVQAAFILRNKLNHLRCLRLEDEVDTNQLFKKHTYAEVLEMAQQLMKDNSIEVTCDKHPFRKARYLSQQEFILKCSICQFKEPTEAYMLKGEGMRTALENLRKKTKEKFGTQDSFNIHPLLLKRIESDDILSGYIAWLRKIITYDDERLFISYCPKCSKQLSNETARRYPCQKAHLICKLCAPDDSMTTCYYDNQQYLHVKLRDVRLETLYATNPVCPLCLKQESLKQLPCNHSLCSGCLKAMISCPICNKEYSKTDAEEAPEDTFLNSLRVLSCVKCSSNSPVAKIANETCQFYCAECYSVENRLFSFEQLNKRLESEEMTEFIDHKINELMEEALEEKHSGAYNEQRIIELKESMQKHPRASPELVELLRQYPNISLNFRSKLLYFLKTDCFDCDNPAIEESVGWRIHEVRIPDLTVALRFNSVLPPQFCTNFRSPTRGPQFVDETLEQFEVVGLTADHEVQLHGVVIAASCYQEDSAELNFFNIYTTQQYPEMDGFLLFSKACFKEFPHARKDSLMGGQYKPVMFNRPFYIKRNKPYILSFQLAGSPSFYRGNPYHNDLRAFPVGADHEITSTVQGQGVDFTFTEVVSKFKKERKANEDNAFTGALLGLIYKIS